MSFYDEKWAEGLTLQEALRIGGSATDLSTFLQGIGAVFGELLTMALKVTQGSPRRGALWHIMLMHDALVTKAALPLTEAMKTMPPNNELPLDLHSVAAYLQLLHLSHITLITELDQGHPVADHWKRTVKHIKETYDMLRGDALKAALGDKPPDEPTPEKETPNGQA